MIYVEEKILLNKKIMLLVILLVSLLAVSTVSAAENVTDDIVSVEETTDEAVSVEVNQIILKENNAGTFTDLANEIANATSELNLTRDYAYDEDSDRDYKDGIGIDKSITVNGNGFTIDGNKLAKSFKVNSNNVLLININFINNVGTNGASVYWEGNNGSIVNCSFVNCSSGYGGAVNWRGPDGYLADSIFIGNSASNRGGAVYWVDVGGIISDCSFINNFAGEYGGAVSWYHNDGYLANSVFVNCSAGLWGGAIHWLGSDGVLDNCSFVNSSATEYGGAVVWFGSDGILANCSFVNSSSNFSAGAVYLASVNGVLDNCSFVNSSATEYGGAVSWYNGGGALFDCSFVNSSVGDYGGAVYCAGSDGILSGCNFVNSTSYGSGYGGAVYWIAENGVLANCSFVNSSASEFGGAVEWVGVNGVIDNSIFIGNSAGSCGGAVYSVRYSPIVRNCTFINNTAAQYSGAVYKCDVMDCIFKGNTAGISGNDAFPLMLSLTVPDFTSSYNSGDKLIINLKYKNVTITGAVVTIKVYKRNSLVSTQNCLSGDGWVVDLNPGNYTALVSFNGDDIYAPSNAIANVVVTKADMAISAVYYTNDMKLVATLVNGANGKSVNGANIQLNINGSNTTVKTNSKGKISVSTADLPSGNYSAAFSYKGNSKYNPANTNIDFTTARFNMNISATYDADNLELIATLINEGTGKPVTGANVQFNLKYTSITVKTNSKGQAKLSSSDLPLGTYEATICYKGNGKYNSANTSIVVDVKTKVIITDVYGYFDKLVATLTNGATGSPITNANMQVEINGVNATVKSDSKGQISLNTSDLGLTKYDVTISYAGNDRYTPSSATTTIDLNKANMMITYSYSANKHKLVATLKNSKTGNIVSNANMVVDINGVKTTLKSNSNGQITFSTADFAPGTYVGTISYGGNAKYNSISAAFKVVV